MIETKNNPYYDDFDLTKGFLKVLFKPGLSVQTRELNQLQSILQSQLGQLSDSIFKDGSVVKDGKLTFKNDVNYVKVYDSYNNSNFSYNNFKDRMLAGTFTLENNTTVYVVSQVFDGFDRNNNNPGTLYLDYLGSGATSLNTENIPTYTAGQVLKLVNEIYVDNVDGTFIPMELVQGDNTNAPALMIQTDNNKFSILYTSNLRFSNGETIRGATSGATAIFTSGETEQLMVQVQNVSDVIEPVGVGSFAILSSGIYYVEGYFVNVEPQRIILDEYSPLVSAKVGFTKEVEYISATEDNSLYDNANGTPNENAPGADRLKLTLVLTQYGLYDEIPEQFIEIARINQSNVVFNTSNNSQWATIMDVLAKRTYDESGNYTVNSFIIDINEFLNEDDNNGIYKEEYFGYKTEVEALNASMEIFGLPEPGQAHRYNGITGSKYYPLNDHDTFLSACRDRVAVGINPGLAYVLGYEINLEQKIYVPMLKARDYGKDNNSLLNVKYGNYVLVNNVTYLPNITQTSTINLCSANSYDTSHIIGTARLRMIRHYSGTMGTTDEQFKLYLTDINVNSPYSFTDSVKSLGIDNFSCKAVTVDGAFNLYDIDKNKLLFKLGQSSVRSLEDVTYIISRYATSVENQVIDTEGNLTLSAQNDTNFYSYEPSDYLLTMTSGASAGQIVNLNDSSVSIELEGNPTGSILKIHLPLSYAGCGWILIAPVRKNDDTNSGLKKKTLVSNYQENITSPTDNITLSHVDGYRLIGVYDSGDPDTPATTGSTNVTSNYTFDGGQRDDYYGPSHLIHKENTAEPAGRLLVVYDYFSHMSGDYYSAESYTETIDYEDIPTYTTADGVEYNLSDCVDFRPDYDGTSTYDTINGKTLIPNSNFESDINYYLPRIDLLEVDYLGNFKIKKGESAVNPQTPVVDINSMGLYYLEIPSYTANINDIAKVYKENRRYTMKDIGVLDNRITAIENYIMMTQNEFDASNTPIIGEDGGEKYKVGFIADNFLDHSYGDIRNAAYKCSIDVNESVLMPSFRLNSLELAINSDETSTVADYNGKYMIPKTDVDMIVQTTGTSLQRMNESGLVSWKGNLLISPSVNNIYNNIDQSKQNFGDNSDYLNQINGVISNVSNTLEYGNFYKNWIGTN